MQKQQYSFILFYVALAVLTFGHSVKAGKYELTDTASVVYKGNTLSFEALLTNPLLNSADSLVIENKAASKLILSADSVIIEQYTNQKISLSIDSIYKLAGKEFFLYHSTAYAFKIHPININKQHARKDLMINPVIYEGFFPPYHNAFIGLLLGLSIFLILLKLSFPKKYGLLFSIYKSFSFRTIEPDTGRQRFFEQDNLLLAFIYTFLSASLLFILITLGSIDSYEITDGSSISIIFMKLWAFCILIFCVKLILVSAMSALYKLGSYTSNYMKELINMSILMVLSLLILNYTTYLIMGEINETILKLSKYLLVFFYLLRIVFLHFKILKLSGFTNLYLFSYFCTTEIFPFLIGLKYFF